MIVGFYGLLWRWRFARAVRRFDPTYPLLAAWRWACASHEDALIEFEDFNEPVPTPEDAVAFELQYAREL